MPRPGATFKDISSAEIDAAFSELALDDRYDAHLFKAHERAKVSRIVFARKRGR